MLLSYELGEANRPRGHALLYFRSWSDPEAVFATYLIIPPIAVEISKYIPPMFASQFQGMRTGGISVFPYPPIPERVDDPGLLRRLASARDDDLISGGSIDTNSPERLLQAAAEAAQQYFQSFSTYVASLPSEEVEQTPAVPGADISVDVNELEYILMSDRERLTEMSKFVGRLRDAVVGGDEQLASSIAEDFGRLAAHLPEKYRAAEVLSAARRPGAAGNRLTQLYIERAFRLADEDYEAVSRLELEIKHLSGQES